MNLKHNSLIILISILALSCIGQTKAPIKPDNDRELFLDQRTGVSKGDAGDVVTQGLLDTNGNMWFTSLIDGVYKYDGNSFTNYQVKDGLCSNKVNTVIQDSKGLIWFGTDNGLCSFDGRIFTNVPLPPEDPSDVSPETGLPSRYTQEVLSLLEDNNGDLWIGTLTSGALHYDGKQFTSYMKFRGRVQPDNVYNNVIQSMVEDHSGNIWFTSQTHGGISRFDGKGFKHFDKEDGLPDDMVFSSVVEQNGNLWFGTLDGGLISNIDGSFKYYDETDGLNNNMVSCFHQDKAGKLWIGSFRESTVTWFENNIFTSFPFDIDHKLVELRFITEDRNGHIWFGGRYGLLYRFDGKELMDFTQLKKVK